MADAQQQPIASMDPEGNAYDNYKREVGLGLGRLGKRCVGVGRAGVGVRAGEGWVEGCLVLVLRPGKPLAAAGRVTAGRSLLLTGAAAA